MAQNCETLTPNPTPMVPNQVSIDTAIKGLSLLDGVAFLVATVVGSGMFFAPGLVAQLIGSPCGSFLSFIIGGVISLFGAFCYSELGTTYVSSSADALYLRKAFGNAMSFAFTWTMFLVIGSGACAGIAVVLGNYLVEAFGFESQEFLWTAHLLAIGAVAIIFCINVYLPNHIARMNKFMFWIKIGISVFVALGSLYGPGSEARANAFLFRAEGCWAGTHWSNLVRSVPFTLFAYSGWNMLNSMTPSIENPSRDLPRIYALGMTTVVMATLLFCISFFSVLPLSEMTSKLAAPFAMSIWGPSLRSFLSLMIALCCFGSVNGNFVGTVRICQSAAESGHFPDVFARLRNKVPYTSSLLLGCWVAVLIVTACCGNVFFGVDGISAIVKFYVIGQYLFFALIALALIRLRFSDPDTRRPYSVLFYPLTPIIFIVAAFVILASETVPSLLSPTGGSDLSDHDHFDLVRFFGLSGGDSKATGVDIWALIGFLVAIVSFGVGYWCKSNASLKLSESDAETFTTIDMELDESNVAGQ